jgi:IclR family transcriptional regulator, KDG regulon repressor
MPMLQTIRQSGDVLELFTRQDPEWGVREVARRLAIPKSNAHQLLASLEGIGLLHRMITGRYRLGFRLLTLGQFLLANTPWRDVAHRVLVQASAELRETVHVAVLDGGNLIYVDKVMGEQINAIRSAHSTPGNSIPPFSSALGRVLLASKSWRVVQTALERHVGSQAQTKHTTTNLEVFKSELIRVARQGFALDLEESTMGVCCIAAPVRNHNGDVIAAISVSIKATRASGISDSLREAIIGQADSLSGSIGFDQEWITENRGWSRRARRP